MDGFHSSALAMCPCHEMRVLELVLQDLNYVDFFTQLTSTTRVCKAIEMKCLLKTLREPIFLLTVVIFCFVFCLPVLAFASS